MYDSDLEKFLENVVKNIFHKIFDKNLFQGISLYSFMLSKVFNLIGMNLERIGQRIGSKQKYWLNSVLSSVHPWTEPRTEYPRVFGFNFRS